MVDPQSRSASWPSGSAFAIALAMSVLAPAAVRAPASVRAEACVSNARARAEDDAACAFLAEAAAAPARRPRAAAAAAAAALRARYGGRGAPRWPRIARWMAAREVEDAMDVDVAPEDDAGGGPLSEPPVLAAGTAGEDLELSLIHI